VIQILQIHTSQFRYSGTDRLDITIKSGTKIFAPTWDMVMGYKNKLITEEQYTTQYLHMLDKSLSKNKSEWDKLLSMDEVTFVCYCPKNVFCHRHLLASYLLNKFPDKVVLRGER